MGRDVFLCHASEDKDRFVRPFAKALENVDISYWFDEAEIAWGDDIIQAINTGLKDSNYVIIFCSSFFINKYFPMAELNSFLIKQANTGEIKILPLLIGNIEFDEALDKFYLLRSNRWLKWSGDSETLNKIISDLQNRLGRKQAICLNKTNLINKEESIYGKKTYSGTFADTIRTFIKFLKNINRR